MKSERKRQKEERTHDRMNANKKMRKNIKKTE